MFRFMTIWVLVTYALITVVGFVTDVIAFIAGSIIALLIISPPGVAFRAFFRRRWRLMWLRRHEDNEYATLESFISKCNNRWFGEYDTIDDDIAWAQERLTHFT